MQKYARLAHSFLHNEEYLNRKCGDFCDRRLSTSVLRPNIITHVVMNASTLCECTLRVKSQHVEGVIDGPGKAPEFILADLDFKRPGIA